MYEILLTARSDVATPEQVLEAAERSIEILIDNGATHTHLEQALGSVMRDLASAGLDVANDVKAQALTNTVQARVRCTGWNTDGYFETTPVEQITACLETSAVDLDALNASGFTPLQAAAVYARTPDVIEALLAAGADPTATNSRVESGRLGVGDTVRSTGAYQDSYSFEGGFSTVVVEVRSDDFHPLLIVETPSGVALVDRYYQGDAERAQLSLTLDEAGEYQVLVIGILDDEGAYTLRISGEMPGYLAARNNENLAVLQVFLNAGLDPDHKKDDGTTLLHWAARDNENPAVIEALLAAGANVREDDDEDRTPLHDAAAYNENPAVIEALLAAGANVREDDDEDRTPLHLAAMSNTSPAVVEALMVAGANLEARHRLGLMPLHMAAAYNENPAVIEALIAAGADIGATEDLGFLASRDNFDHGRTPLHSAAQFNPNPVFIETLLAAGADLEARDKQGGTPLHRAARYNGNPSAVEVLLAAGADLEVELDPGIGAGSIAYIARSTPLHEAASFGSPSVIEALLAAGADPTKRDDDRATLLHRAARYNNDPAALEIVLATGADLEARDDEERTPLNVAARYNDNPSVIEALINAGAAVEAQDEDGRTPLYRATDENDNPAVREVLLAAGAGQTERQRAAARARREDNSGPGFFDFAVAAIGGTAIAAAGGGTDEAVAAGGVFAEGVLSGNPPAGNSGGGLDPGVSSPAGNTGITAGGGSCQVPNYPSPPGGVANLGFPWCPASVDNPASFICSPGGRGAVCTCYGQLFHAGANQRETSGNQHVVRQAGCLAVAWYSDVSMPGGPQAMNRSPDRWAHLEGLREAISGRRPTNE